MTTNKYWLFLERLRRRGVNVYGAPIDLMHEFNVTRREARKILQNWIANYNEKDYEGMDELGD